MFDLSIGCHHDRVVKHRGKLYCDKCGKQVYVNNPILLGALPVISAIVSFVVYKLLRRK